MSPAYFLKKFLETGNMLLIQLLYNHHLVSSVGRAPVCCVGGRGFKPHPDDKPGSLNN